MNKFIGDLKDGSGKLYESEYGQKFILSNDGSSVRLVLNDTEEIQSKILEEQRKYFEEHQDEFKERIKRYNSGQINVRWLMWLTQVN